MELRSQMPHFFRNEPDDYSFLWMCAFNSYAEGKYVKKPEYECSGMKILEAILQSLTMDEATRQKCRDEIVAAIPVAMPYIDSQFLPRAAGDLPAVVPEGSRNLGFTCQFCEIPEDVVLRKDFRLMLPEWQSISCLV